MLLRIYFHTYRNNQCCQQTKSRLRAVFSIFFLSKIEQERARLPVVDTVEQLKDLPPGSYIVSGEATAELARQFAKRFD